MEYSDPTLLSPEVAYLAKIIQCPKIIEMAQRKSAILKAHGLIEVYDPKSRQSHIYNNGDSNNNNRFEEGSGDDDEDEDYDDEDEDDFEEEEEEEDVKRRERGVKREKHKKNLYE